MISIVSYGMGNIGSIVNMLKRVNAETEIITTAEQILRADKILIPGVGAFDAAMEKIDGLGLRAALDQKVLVEKVPVLGICLGMQLLTKSSDEGKLPGLGWIDARTLSFRKAIGSTKLKVPHMGWNTVRLTQSSSVTDGLVSDEARFYFVHSYYVRSDREKNVILKSEYGIEFDSAIQQDNVFGAQFHPEKSHKFGIKFLENFARI